MMLTLFSSKRTKCDMKTGRVRGVPRPRAIRRDRRRELVLPALPVGEAGKGAQAPSGQRRCREDRVRQLRQDVAPAAEVLRHAGHRGAAATVEGGSFFFYAVNFTEGIDVPREIRLSRCLERLLLVPYTVRVQLTGQDC